MTEAFNSMLGTHRAQTYLQLLEFIRRIVMRKLQERKEECEAWRDVLPPRVNARILKNSQASRQLTIISVGDQEYELLGPDGTFPVKLKEYYCGCGSWQISGIPCAHAMAAISHSFGKQSLKDLVPNFVHQSLTKNAYIQTYRGMIHPLPDQNMWPTVETDVILPPPYETQPGRPKLQRKREAGEKAKGARSGTVICKLCGMAGHNKRTCKKTMWNKKRLIVTATSSNNCSHNIIDTNNASFNIRDTNNFTTTTSELFKEQENKGDF
ncbi:hypothetical protein Dsin_006690 [Dipteronia sinensis]|uniref:SWIM-type domain-containing protein n=1 Tax=Dipteronia sinensis TaxID=43782 RepID=A0AAE0AYU4_9ROSI|nr:hypothetical protein Dsin_006690 [Dipteronia sinensis]